MFELWCKRSYFLAERDNYIALKKRETIIQISEHFQALSIPSCMLYMSPSQMRMWLHAFAYCLVVNQPFWKLLTQNRANTLECARTHERSSQRSTPAKPWADRSDRCRRPVSPVQAGSSQRPRTTSSGGTPSELMNVGLS